MAALHIKFYNHVY